MVLVFGVLCWLLCVPCWLLFRWSFGFQGFGIWAWKQGTLSAVKKRMLASVLGFNVQRIRGSYPTGLTAERGIPLLRAVASS